MKQIALALHNYHDAHKVFPPSCINPGAAQSGTSGRTPGAGLFIPRGSIRNFTGYLLLLPYTDQAPVYDKINFSAPTGEGDWIRIGGGGTQPVLHNLKFPVYRCPSDVEYLEPHTYAARNMYTITNATRASYAFVHESHEYDGEAGGKVWNKNRNLNRSAFGINGAARVDDIKDGTSTTMLMIETPYRKCSFWFGPFVQAYVHTHFIVPVHLGTGWNGNIPEWGINRWTPRGDNPRARECNNGLPIKGGNRFVYAWAAGSLHVGGAHAIMGDGSVRFLSEVINLKTLGNLVSVNNADVPGEF